MGQTALLPFRRNACWGFLSCVSVGVGTEMWTSLYFALKPFGFHVRFVVLRAVAIKKVLLFRAWCLQVRWIYVDTFRINLFLSVRNKNKVYAETLDSHLPKYPMLHTQRPDARQSWPRKPKIFRSYLKREQVSFNSRESCWAAREFLAPRSPGLANFCTVPSW